MSNSGRFSRAPSGSDACREPRQAEHAAVEKKFIGSCLIFPRGLARLNGQRFSSDVRLLNDSGAPDEGREKEREKGETENGKVEESQAAHTWLLGIYIHFAQRHFSPYSSALGACIRIRVRAPRFYVSWQSVDTRASERARARIP